VGEEYRRKKRRRLKGTKGMIKKRKKWIRDEDTILIISC
jgi:hypothetical protein